MDGVSKRPYTIRGTERFATSRSQRSIWLAETREMATKAFDHLAVALGETMPMAGSPQG